MFIIDFLIYFLAAFIVIYGAKKVYNHLNPKPDTTDWNAVKEALKKKAMVGAAKLDVDAPNWVKEIISYRQAWTPPAGDTSKLFINEAVKSDCVLGRLFGSDQIGRSALRINDAEAIAMGFDLSLKDKNGSHKERLFFILSEVWIEIIERKEYFDIEHQLALNSGNTSDEDIIEPEFPTSDATRYFRSKTEYISPKKQEKVVPQIEGAAGKSFRRSRNFEDGETTYQVRSPKVINLD